MNMRIIKAGSKELKLDIGEELLVKDFRKISKYLSDTTDGFSLIYNVVGELAIDKEEAIEVLDNMTMPEFTELSEIIGSILSTEKKTTP